MSSEQLKALTSGGYTANDICDALLKLQVPHAGYLVDLVPRTTHPTDGCPLVLPATTVTFLPRATATPGTPQIPYADFITAPSTIAVLSQPAGQRCACLGGLVAKRLSVRGVRGIVAGGRVRDINELEALGMPVWSAGVSAVGAGAEALPVAVDLPVQVAGVTVEVGDVVFMDRQEGGSGGGVVVVPRGRVGEVLEVLPRLAEADRLVALDLEEGMPLAESFKLRRGA